MCRLPCSGVEVAATKGGEEPSQPKQTAERPRMKPRRL
jgi:hypothetical protein